MGSLYDWSKDQRMTEREPDHPVQTPPPPEPPELPELLELPEFPKHPEPPKPPEPPKSVPPPAWTPRRRASRRRRQLRRRNLGIAAVLLCVLIVLLVWRPWSAKDTAPSLPEGEENQNAETGPPLIAAPEWVSVQMLPINKYSRPGTLLSQVNGVVVHYVGNPGTTAAQNRSYYASLAETQETYASSHFVIDTDGAVLQCVPLNEVAYCSNNRNNDTISIECCHLDDTGKFTPETVASLTRLLNWLIDTYKLEREDILRHYDVTGKECPRYYVRNPEQWESLLDTLTFPVSTGT